MLRVALVGCGGVGHLRAGLIAADPEARLVAVNDLDPQRAAALAGETGAETVASWEAAVGRDDVDAVIVSATNDTHTPIGTAALAAGKHVLVEKPGARSSTELERFREAVREQGVVAKVGFNHRYHPALRKARRSCRRKGRSAQNSICTGRIRNPVQCAGRGISPMPYFAVYRATAFSSGPCSSASWADRSHRGTPAG